MFTACALIPPLAGHHTSAAACHMFVLDAYCSSANPQCSAHILQMLSAPGKPNWCTGYCTSKQQQHQARCGIHTAMHCLANKIPLASSATLKSKQSSCSSAPGRWATCTRCLIAVGAAYNSFLRLASSAAAHSHLRTPAAARGS